MYKRYSIFWGRIPLGHGLGLARSFRSMVQRIEPSQPKEREQYVPVSIVEDCMKQIDMIVWHLNLGDLEKPFDINNCEICITARTGPAAKPPQTSSGPI